MALHSKVKALALLSLASTLHQNFSGQVHAQNWEEPIDCLTPSPFFGASSGSVEKTDMTRLRMLSADHKINSIRVCTDGDNRNVLGL